MIDLVITVVVILVIASVALLLFKQSRTPNKAPSLNRFQREQQAEIERLRAQGRYLTPAEADARAGGAS